MPPNKTIIALSALTGIIIIGILFRGHMPEYEPFRARNRTHAPSPASKLPKEEVSMTVPLAPPQAAPTEPPVSPPVSPPVLPLPPADPPIAEKCSEGCGGYKCIQKLDNHRFNNWGGLCTENVWGQVYPVNAEPISTRLMTGPRAAPIARRRALIVIICGESGKTHVPALVEKFGVLQYRFMLMHYDSSDWSGYPWYNDVISIRFPKQMKWWYVKRFVTPEMMDSYDYLGVFDEDVGVVNFNVTTYLNIMSEYNISLSQPGVDPKSTRWTWPVTLQKADNPNVGRWVDFVECGPATFFSRDMYQKCVYDFLREDLASGWGYDLYWHKFCQAAHGFNRSAVTDHEIVFHDGSLRSTSGTGTRYVPQSELNLIATRMDALGPYKTAMITIRHITEADRVGLA